MTDLADLRAKAEAATPGPWETNDPGIVIFPEWGGWLAEEDTENQEADAAYIAAASPATILALLDRITYLEDELEAELRLAAQGRQAPR